MRKRFLFLSTLVLSLVAAGGGHADVALPFPFNLFPRPHRPRPPERGQEVPRWNATGLVVEVDRGSEGPRLLIPRNLLPTFQAGTTSGPGRDGRALGTPGRGLPVREV